MENIYGSKYSTGDRRNLIEISCLEGLTKGGNVKDLINGQMDNSFFFYQSIKNAWILFKFNEPVLIREIKWTQSGDYKHGNWVLQGSDDNLTFTDIGEPFILNNGTFTFNTNFAHKYYKLNQVGGETTNGPWLNEIEFGILPENKKYLLCINNKYYSIKPNMYDILTGEYLECDKNFEMFGFDNVSSLTEVVDNVVATGVPKDIEGVNMFEFDLNNDIEDISLI